LNKNFVLIQSCFQHPEIPVAHNPAEILFGQACAFFITRAKKNMQFYRRSSRPVDGSRECSAIKPF
jgi:hypothetical protein